MQAQYTVADASISGDLTSETNVVLGGSVQRRAIVVGFDSVGGCEKAIQLMRELIELPPRFPRLWTTASVATPKGGLLHGPPGCGKMLIANDLVEETGADVIIINGQEKMARKRGDR
jgi:transitional endoplasmic reticulum ATPase